MQPIKEITHVISPMAWETQRRANWVIYKREKIRNTLITGMDMNYNQSVYSCSDCKHVNIKPHIKECAKIGEWCNRDNYFIGGGLLYECKNYKK